MLLNICAKFAVNMEKSIVKKLSHFLFDDFEVKCNERTDSHIWSVMIMIQIS